MALGSSAPEILLNVIETVGNLNACPGELGASTIVGSAAFNLLVISGVCLMVVNKDNDKSEKKDEGIDRGVKKINDMGVFAVTGFFSVFAYIWMYIVLMDQKVELWEAIVTFMLFVVLIILAYAMDKMRQNSEKKKRV